MRTFIRFAAVLLIVVASSCSKFSRIQKNPDVNEKYKAAVAYYEDKEYYKADLLFEEIIPLLKGNRESELAQFYQAYSKYNMGSYIESEYLFKRFYETFSRSEMAEEAMHMRALSLYEQSPTYELDQTSTLAAITALQTYINAYPESKRVERATNLLRELRAKLEKKAYEQAVLYAKIGDFKAAVVAFNNFQRGYPDSDYNEEIAFLRVQSAYNLAKQSIQTKKNDRFREAIGYYQAFIDQYPQSRYVKDAEKYYSDSVQEVGGTSANPDLQSSNSNNSNK
jgi:outer membrane protein assembly factor BamD